MVKPPSGAPPSPRVSTRLIERLDYYVEEGKVVFTAHYLLKRGYCCNKGCRHCPYTGKDAPRLTVRIVGIDDPGSC